MNNNNYILARWRDAITDPPKDGWHGRVAAGDTWAASFGLWHDAPCWTDAATGKVFAPEPGDLWLDESSTPAVPRAAVQAAVDVASLAADEWENGNLKRLEYASGVRSTIRTITDITGVTPTEDSK